MSKAIRGGHNHQATGAYGIVDEVTEDRKIYPCVIKYLEMAGDSVLDVTAPNCDEDTDLVYGVRLANSNKVDYFASIHLNSTRGATPGCEVVYGSEAGREIANRICYKLSKLGFNNRGAKPDVRGLYEIHHTDMIANIVEVFFCDSQVDVDIYNRVGADAIGKAIAEGILGHDIAGGSTAPVVTPQPAPQPKPSVQSDPAVLDIQRKLNRLKIRDSNGNALIEDGIMGECTRSAIRRFQSIMGLVIDGIVGNNTMLAFNQIFAKPLDGVEQPHYEYATRYIQWRVGATIDGVYGYGTKGAVARWQANNELSSDGVVGQATWRSLIG